MELYFQLLITNIFHFLSPYIIFRKAQGAILSSELHEGYGYLPGYEVASEHGLTPSLNS